MKYWRIFPSTRYCLPLWLTKNRLPFVADSWCHMSITFSSLFQLVSNVTVYGCNLYWTQWNKGQIILFWSSCFSACWNILDGGFCDLCVVLKLWYKFFTVLWELHTPLWFETISSLKCSCPCLTPLLPEKIPHQYFWRCTPLYHFKPYHPSNTLAHT